MPQSWYNVGGGVYDTNDGYREEVLVAAEDTGVISVV